ncbi:YfjI family protein [Marinobacter sp. S6332]|uniref:YfjI family protein n=1 Tax=Marinobacter sp. S6332 TaxID=2926403 RepID=UPI001FF64FA5|nr:YfjI family protein [Marinobacter sp. S6332]MCK0163177.1 YfjI family protein [Marinobacter sp. S6332]
MTAKPIMKATDPNTGIIAPLAAIDAKPLPLARKAPLPAYPMSALGELLGDAAKALAYYVQVPVGMAAQSLLAVASLATQGHVNIQKGNIGTSPTTLYCITIAGSGERKSSMDGLAMRPVYEYQAERRAEHESLMAEHKAAEEAHELRYQSIVKSYKGSGQKQKPLSYEQQQALTEDLAELEKSRPKPPPRPHILMEEPTAEGIYKHLAEALPTAGLFSDEGGAFFSGHGMADEAKGRTITMLSQLWDGKAITRTRAGAGESGVLAGRRLAAHLMMQPIIANKVLADPLMKGQGFLARFLVCADESLVGTRFLADRPHDESVSRDPAVIQFWEALSELIRQPLPTNEAGELEPATLTITGAAFETWTHTHDAIERQLSQQGELSEIREFAAKAADNTARIAGVLAYLETRTDPTPEHIERASTLMEYYLNTMIQRTQEAGQNAAEHDAAQVLDWMQRNGEELSADNFKQLPAAYRTAKKARTLLTLLVEYGHVVVAGNGPNGKARKWKVREGQTHV